MKAIFSKDEYVPFVLFIIPAIGMLLFGLYGDFPTNVNWFQSRSFAFFCSNFSFGMLVIGILGIIFAPPTLLKPKKLIRDKIARILPREDFEYIVEQDELNKLYRLKVLEELDEVRQSKHGDIYEFVDLIQVCQAYARVNGFEEDDIMEAMKVKTDEKGGFSDIALTKLNYYNKATTYIWKI